MKREWFVTGTDTGVGKTAVTSALLCAAGSRGHRAIGLKPVESGCGEGALGEDGAALLAAGASGLSAGDITAYALPAPLAPNVAAARACRQLDWRKIAGLVEAARRREPDLLLVEGAGGLLVPLTDEIDMAEAARELGLPLLIVARASLGTINHACLTVEVARSRGLAVGGVILNEVELGTAKADVEENARQIERWARVRVLGVVPWSAEGTRVDLGGLSLADVLPG